MALAYRKGSSSIEEAANKRGTGSNYRPFLPQIQWREDETKYVLVLTDIEDVAELLLHSFVPVGKGTKNNGEEYVRYEDFLSRKMSAIGEDYDDIEDRLGRLPKTRHMGVMVELDPVFEPGTKKLTSFVVKTETFTRRIDDDEVEVTVPVLGLCVQSAQLMWGPLNNLYNQLGTLLEVPLSITKKGQKTNTRYDFIPFMDKSVDLSPVLDFFDGISYIGDDLDDLVAAVDAADTLPAAVQTIADFLMNKRIDELADKKRYDEFIAPLDPDTMPAQRWEAAANKAKATPPARPGRPARRSQRDVEKPVEVEHRVEEPETTASVRSERFAKLKARIESGS